MSIDTDFDLLMYFFKAKVPLNLAFEWVAYLMEAGEGILTWHDMKYLVTRRVDIGGYPSYAVTKAPITGD
jgi:hypothetical protein